LEKDKSRGNLQASAGLLVEGERVNTSKLRLRLMKPGHDREGGAAMREKEKRRGEMKRPW